MAPETATTRVLTWNLFHGRSVPDVPRDLCDEFAATLAGWAWDVALLQEVPPWWPAVLARAAGAQERSVLTSRNALAPLRRALAHRRPDIVKSHGGGANAILVRGAAIAAHHRVRLRWWPERRVAHAVRLEDGLWVANLHAQAHSTPRATRDIARAARCLDAWSGGATAVLGGDFNLPAPAAPGFAHTAGHGPDHVLARGLRSAGDRVLLDRGTLSDHAPLAVTLIREG